MKILNKTGPSLHTAYHVHTPRLEELGSCLTAGTGAVLGLGVLFGIQTCSANAR